MLKTLKNLLDSLKEAWEDYWGSPVIRCPVHKECDDIFGPQCSLLTCERRHKAIKESLRSTEAT